MSTTIFVIMFNAVKKLINKIQCWFYDYYELVFDYFEINNEDN